MHRFAPSTRKPASPRARALRAAVAVGFALGLASLALLVVRLAEAPSVPLTLGAGAITGSLPRRLRFEWRLVRDRHWQIASSPAESREATDQIEGTRGTCPTGMVEVSGLMKLDPAPKAQGDLRSIDEMQRTTCKHWISRDYPERCAEFDRERWLSMSKDLDAKPMHFCMDRYEYPNQKGVYPFILVSFYEANELCAEEGKRLCDEAEWTFACEGEEARPYPYGYVREPEACVVDQGWRPYIETALRPRGGPAAMAEMDRLWQGMASGVQPRCRSPFGVYDMTGNIDEWTRSVREGERPSILKGGYWGPVRTRCRPSTRSHDENHMFYQQGFRCCADHGATIGVPAERAVSGDPAAAPLPRELR
ncbi:SUMF1/EgtB/PvdO family nonheme iron enzyme [Sorangium sp. So ce726]|uniref:formylglycine-generating enzyme family protein n=1 Tax=Sorangium sp. So ce726 TaxID=3133319 RepID=UPI003F63B859